MARDFQRQPACSLDCELVDKPKLPESSVVAVCPSCGLMSADSPHGTSDGCIRALEAEIRTLSEQIKNLQSPKKKRCVELVT
jgi:hypothetical protein